MAGCNNISTMESCPLQFECADEPIMCCQAAPQCSGGLVASDVPCKAAESQSTCQTVAMCCQTIWCRSATAQVSGAYSAFRAPILGIAWAAMAFSVWLPTDGLLAA